MIQDELLRTIENHVQYLADRPGMFVGDTTLKSIAIHLSGYFQAIMETQNLPLPTIWHYWVSMKYGIWSPAWSWEDTILKNVANESEAIKSLPSLIREFLKELKSVGPEGIKEAHENFNFKGS